MADVSLIAQPHDKKPLLSIFALKNEEYKPRRKGTFGTLWFTDIGAATWEACMQTDPEARIRLRDHGLDELNWTIYFKAGDYQIRLETIRYTGMVGKVNNVYCLLKVRHEDRAEIRHFIEKVYKALGNTPFGFKKSGAIENFTDKTPQQIREEWESILGHSIERPEGSTKGRKRKAMEKKKEEKTRPASERRKPGMTGFGALTSKLTDAISKTEADAPARDETEPEPEIQVLECPECGADVPFPEGIATIKCPGCGLEGEAPERSEPLLFECPACDKDIEVWSQEMPETLECPHCGVSGSLGEKEEAEEEPAKTDRAGRDEPDEPAGDLAKKEKSEKKPVEKAEKDSKAQALVRPGTEKKKAAINAPAKASEDEGDFLYKVKGDPHPDFKGYFIHDDYYLINDKGVKFDRALLEKAAKIVEERDRHHITVKDCDVIYDLVADADKYTDTEKRTMRYIREHFKFTDAADRKFRHMIGSWAAKRGARTRKEHEAQKKGK